MHLERAMRAQPILRSMCQAADNLIVVNGVKASKLRPRGTARREGILVDLGEYPAGKSAVLPGKPKPRLNASEVRIERAGEEAKAVDVKRRRKSRLTAVKEPRQPAEGQKIPQPIGRKNIDRERGGLHGRPLFQTAVTRAACRWSTA